MLRAHKRDINMRRYDIITICLPRCASYLASFSGAARSDAGMMMAIGSETEAASAPAPAEEWAPAAWQDRRLSIAADVAEQLRVRSKRARRRRCRYGQWAIGGD